MLQLKKFLTFLAKCFIGYALVATPTFALPFFALHISIRELLIPYFSLFFVTTFGVIQMFNARHYVDEPNSFAIRVSLTMLVFFLISQAIIYYFGIKYGVIDPEYSTMIISIGIIGTVGISIRGFFYMRRWVRLRNFRN